MDIVLSSSCWRMVIAGLAVTLVAGCVASTESTGHRSAPAPERTADSNVAMTAAPRERSCHAVPADKAFDADHAFDASRVVPCSHRHDTQTVTVIELPHASVNAMLEVGPTCFDAAVNFVGADLDHWIPWKALLYLPSRAQVARGASWARCDVAFPADWPPSRPAWTTLSAESVALAPPESLWGCLNHYPRLSQSQPLVPCRQPHRYEATGTLALLGVDAYPPQRRRHRAGQTQCRSGAMADSTGAGALRIVAQWQPRAVFDGSELIGFCWYGREDGQLLPPRR